MSAQPLPWFHSTSLRQRFMAHAQASLTAGEITTEEHQWLSSITAANRDHQPTAAQQLRIDGITAVTSDGQRFELPATVRLSRGGHTTVVMLYNPLLGLRRFAEPLQLKQFLLDSIGAAGAGAALRFPATAAAQRVVQARPVEAFEGSLLSGDVFQALMLRLHAGLADNLAQMREWVRDQPTPDEMLAPADGNLLEPAVRAGIRLAHYWDNAATAVQPCASSWAQRCRPPCSSTCCTASRSATWNPSSIGN